MKEVAVMVSNPVQFYSVKPLLEAMDHELLKYDLILPDWNAPEFRKEGWAAMENDLEELLDQLGFPYLKAPAHDEYKVSMSSYPLSGDVKSIFKVSYNYGYVPKPYFHAAPRIKLYYDYILCYGKIDEEFFSVYAKTCIVGEPKLLGYKRKEFTREKPKVLYLPTYGDLSSVRDAVPVLKNLSDKYEICAKAHHGTSFLTSEKDNLNVLLQTFSKIYNSKTPLYDLLAETDVVLSDNSGAIYDALAAGIPVARFATSEPETIGGFIVPYLELAEKGVLPSTDDPAGIENVLKQAMTEKVKALQAAAAKQMFFDPEKGKNDFIDLIKSLLNIKEDSRVFCLQREKNRYREEQTQQIENLKKTELEPAKEKLKILQQYTDAWMKHCKEQPLCQFQPVQTALELLQSIMASRTFCLLHFYNRIKCQLLAGNWAEKKAFFRWLFHRSSVPGDAHYQPLFGPYHALLQADEIVYPFPELPAAEKKEQGCNNILRDTVLPYGNLFLQIEQKKEKLENLSYRPYKKQPVSELQSMIGKCSYKGVVICPDRNTGLLLPILQKAVKNEWLCFVCSEDANDVSPKKLDENIYLANESDVVRVLCKEKVVIFTADPGSIPFVDQFSRRILWYHLFNTNEDSFKSQVEKTAYEITRDRLLVCSNVVSYDKSAAKEGADLPAGAICLTENGAVRNDFDEQIPLLQSILYDQFSKLSADKNNIEELEHFLELLRKEALGKRIVIFPPTIDWNMPMFQRPQQLACAYARKDNTIVIYFTSNYMHENISVAQMPRQNLWVVNAELAEKVCAEMEDAHEVILSIAWATNQIYLDKIRADKIIYDYIDDLTIFYNYGPELIRMHEDLVKRAQLTVCTATSLYDQVAGQAQKAIVSTNACDYEHFKTTPQAYVQPEIQKLAEMYSVVIGYYGALAKWFDYDLIKEVAKKKPDWLWLLIGMDYDGSMAKAEMSEIPNIVYAGLQPYEKLPGFLNVFDVATIPFKVNDITRGTSPVKIFEYMAGNKPIVAAQLPECMKYNSVFTYQDADDFCLQIEKAVGLRADDPYWSILREDALRNTWDVKTDEILSALGFD